MNEFCISIGLMKKFGPCPARFHFALFTITVHEISSKQQVCYWSYSNLPGYQRKNFKNPFEENINFLHSQPTSTFLGHFLFFLVSFIFLLDYY